MYQFGWHNHPAPLQTAWDTRVAPTDVVIVAGDISWATRPSEVLDDLAWLDRRPGQKVLLRGNHDYWWGGSATKLRKLFEPYRTVAGFLHNSAVVVGPWLIAGSRLWTTPEAPPLPGGELGGEATNKQYVQREAARLRMSIDDAVAKERHIKGLTRIIAAHFPPLYVNEIPTAFTPIIEGFAPRVCVYGHLHGPGIAAGFVGDRKGVRYVLASCDAAGFTPLLLLEHEG